MTTTMWKSYDEMKLNSRDGGNYLDWSLKEIEDKKRTMMVQTDHINPDGSITKCFQQKNFSSSNDRIDGHFWLEDMNGNIISDGGFSSYQHRLPCFEDFNPKTDFIVYQPVLCPKMEQEIIDRQITRIKKSWGRDAFTDGINEDLFKASARQMWNEKARMLERGFECLQYSICEHLYRTEKGEKCRIRFGCAGVVYPKLNRRENVFWFFGHLDNTKVGEWIVKDAVSPDGTKEKTITHDRWCRLNEVPNAVKEMERRDEVKRLREEREKEIVKEVMEKKQKLAEKALEELLAEDWVNEKPVAPKKNKNKKKKGKK